ncbi:MAG TPA: M1 family metallopeptidase [Steroidobacteraceae bacterium]|jgi:alanyl aminopeptidase
MPNTRRFHGLLAAACAALFCQAASGAEAPPPGQLGRAVVPVHYAIDLSIDPSKDEFSGSVDIDVTLAEPRAAIWLHGKDLKVSESYATVGASRRIAATYAEKLDSGVALLSFAETLPAGPLRLHIAYSAPFNTSGNALFKVVRGERAYAVTQFEAIAARQAFPGFDEPGFKTPFDIAITSRKDDVAVTATPETGRQDLADGSVRHVFKTTRPLPTYLIAFAVGPYDVADIGPIPPNAVRNRPLPLRGIAANGQGKRFQYALENTTGLLSALEAYFGTPYPFDKLDLIAVPENFGGAMENVGAITYDESLMLMDANSPVDQRRDFTTTHAHEMAHMWFGDLVTPAWWNDIWLNEAFATWMEDKAAQAHWPAGEFDREILKGALSAMADDSLVAVRAIRQPVNDSEEANGTFDAITYQKGGGVLSMLERFVGEREFRDGVRQYLKQHEDGTATAEDFIGSIAAVSRRDDIQPAFQSFISQPGVPLVSVRLDCNDPAHPRLQVGQSRYAPLGSAIQPQASQWQIPFCVSWQDGDRRASQCALLAERRQTLNLEAASCPVALLPNADGAGYYRFTVDEGGWRQLIESAPRLKPAEALVLVDALDAAFRAGTVPAPLYLSGLAALVNHDAWDVADAATDRLEDIADIYDSKELPAVESALRALVAPRYARLAGANDTGSELLHKSLQRFLIVMAKDRAMRAPLAAQAAKVIGLEGKSDATAADPAELETVLTVGVQDLGQPFFDKLLGQLAASEDQTFRDAAIGALARVEDPALVRKLQAAVMAKTFKGTEIFRVLNRQMNRPATTESTYAWLRQNVDEILPLVPEGYRSNFVPYLGSRFCSAARADEWRAFVVAHADALPGYERDLDQATESIRLCAALKTARGGELLAAFGSVQ